MIVLFSTLLFSKSGCLLELCYIYLHLLTASTEGVQNSDVRREWNCAAVGRP